MAAPIDVALLRRIDALELSERNRAWRAAMKAAPWRLYADRERWTVKSWRETEGMDLQIRRAELLACILDNLEIKIHPFDEIVGRPTPGVIGCCTAIDVNGDYIPGLFDDDGDIGMTLDAATRLDPESAAVLREATETFRGKTMRDATYRAWEQFVGAWAIDAEAAKLKDPSLDAAITGQSTSTLTWSKILRVGLAGYIDECETRIARYVERGETDVSKIYFWKSAIIVLRAVIRHAGRYAALARQMAEDLVGAERDRLINIAEICEYVPQNPARTFREALQSMQFCNLGKMLENPAQNNCHWGRADMYLYPFFVRDLENGVPLADMASRFADLIGRWGTQTFVSGATQRESHQINFGINSIMVGGLGPDNTDKANALSYLTLHLVALLKLSSPTVCLRWNRDTPNWLMDKAMRTNLETKGGIPLFENDEVVVTNYVKDGIPFAEAVEWASLGCVYPCIPTRAEHYGGEGIAAFNLAGLLHLVLHNGIDVNGKQTGLKTGDPRKFASIDDFYRAFLEQHKFFCHRIFRLGAVARQVQPDYFRTPLLSVLGIEASVELGRDLLFPHPDYSMYGISDRAIIDAADSLTAIDELVFKQKLLATGELLDALDGNFEGARGEEIRQMCLRQPKYGNDIPQADALVRRISEDSARIIRSYDNAPFRRFMISREGLAWHYFGGLGAGALPNGRKAFEPLNDGCLSPMRGTDKNGPTAVLRSACATGFSDVSYASVLNQKFSASLLASDENIDKLIAYTNAYMAAGGSHIQYNIIDSDELKDAKERPDAHRDLIVRIGGFSAYFVQLSPEIQDDVIYRSEFSM
jgi:formate C-acetyltransferase